MGFGWVQKNVSPIAVDFGSDSLKLLQVSTDDPPQLLSGATVDVPSDARAEPAARQAFLTQALRELCHEGGFTGHRAIISIPSADTYVHHLRLTKTDEPIGPEMLETELRGRLPVDPSYLVTRHLEVGEVFADGSAKQEVICLAASRDAVMRYIEAARVAKLDVVGMQCEHLAILQAFAYLYRRTGDEARTTFFVDIGGASTKALICHGPRLVFAKTIQVAGEHFNRQLAGELKIDPAAARLQRYQHAAQAPAGSCHAGPALTADPTPETQRSLRRESVASLAVLEPVTAVARPADWSGGEALDCLIDELQLCVGYHGSMFPQRPIDKLVFLGGESRQLQMCQKIAKALRLSAQLGDPLARLIRNPKAGMPTGLDLRQPQPGWAVPLGLCLSQTNL